MSLHYRPHDGYLGDVIPFYWQGEWHLFYLKAAPERFQGVPFTWEHISSRDLVHWLEWPTALPAGAPGEPDADGAWTGSVVEREGAFHIFYTGYSKRRDPMPQTICHATSSDLAHWRKDAANPILLPDERWYSPGDWRDPFVYWNEGEGCYWMLICSRALSGLYNQRGALALATSPDLERWQVQPPLWQPDLFYSAECPDMFRLGSRYYLVYSTYSPRFATSYRFAESPRGPWLSPSSDNRLDDRLFYAAKTVSNGERRFAFGWVATLTGDRDGGEPQWAGHLGLPREVVAQEDGSLAFRCPPEVLALAGEPEPQSLHLYAGDWSSHNGGYRGERRDGLAYAAIADVGEPVVFEAEVTLAPGTACAGIGLSEHLLRLEARSGRAVLDSWPRAELRLDLPYGKPVRCRLFAADGIIEAFVDDRIVLSVRTHEPWPREVVLFAEEGAATFADVSVRRLR